MHLTKLLLFAGAFLLAAGCERRTLRAPSGVDDAITSAGLVRSQRVLPQDKTVRLIESYDSKKSGAAAAVIWFLEGSALSGESQGLRPRYWLVIEEHASPEAARRRVENYATTAMQSLQQSEIAAQVEGGDVSKHSVRVWAAAIGERVYALTTDTAAFASDSVQRALKENLRADFVK